MVCRGVGAGAHKLYNPGAPNSPKYMRDSSTWSPKKTIEVKKRLPRSHEVGAPRLQKGMNAAVRAAAAAAGSQDPVIEGACGHLI